MCNGSKTMSGSAENYHSSLLSILKSMSVYDTGTQHFCHMKTNLCFYIFFHSELKYVTRNALSPTVLA